MTTTNNLQKFKISELIALARTDAGASVGEASGEGSSLAIVLLANKYNKVFKTNDNLIEDDFIKNTKLSSPYKEKLMGIFDNYHLLQSIFSRKTIIQDEDERHLKIRNLQSQIYLKTLHFLYHLDYLPRQKAGQASTKTRNQIKNEAKKRWIARGKIRSFKEADIICEELESIGIKRSPKTTYDWICEW